MDAAQRIAELEQELAEERRITAAQRVRITQLEQQVADLTKMVAKLLEQLGRHSGNSHLPPSSDGPGGRSGGNGDKKGKKGSGRKRGGQAGHKGHRRNLVPPEAVDDVVNLFPEACEKCWAPLPEVSDADATRFQVAEIPPLRPHITEYRGHAVACTCGHVTRARMAGVVPTSPFGPRLMALAGLLTGVYHLSRRRAGDLLRDVFGISISLGATSSVEKRVSEAIADPVEKARKVVDAAPVNTTVSRAHP